MSKYQKPPLSYSEQISLLQNRGLIFDDLELAANYLTHLNYYRLSAYWHPYKNMDGNFKQNTQFRQIVDHYLFDKSLRLLLLEAIETFEISLRSNWAYILSTTTKKSHAYLDMLDNSIFDRKKNNDYNKTMLDIKDKYKKSKEVFVEHYKKTYKEPELPPIWVICEIFSFGNLVSLYSCLVFKYQKMICKKYGIDDTEVFLSFLRNINAVRNICAHHGRIWNRSLTTCRIKYQKNSDYLRDNLNKTNDSNIYNTIIFLNFIDSNINLSSKNKWIEKIRNYISKSLDENKITSEDLISMGFPSNLKNIK